MSKVAVNMMTRTMATNLRGDGVVLAVIDPGWVQTEMGGPGAPTPVEVSVRGVLAWLDRMSYLARARQSRRSENGRCSTST